jgi:TolB-like protein/Flp pilus assembly protein TadD
VGLTSGSRLGAYEIQSPLGAGGMGEVYRATDTKLGRDVALKVLPAEMAHDPDRLARFRREAKALAQLDHPNIVTIYSVEESEGVHFLTMQLVEGQPLDRLIPQAGLPLEQIIEIAGALGDALAAAHEKGIVHRDLKPANVMVSNEGRVKVLDFGLAKDVNAVNQDDATMTSASRTEVGVVMGTPAYMSPEQTSGRPLDHRTDIFSMGVVLHEMSTGRRPFEGGSPAELVSAILRDTPPSVTDLRPDLPSDLARIVRRCLEKDPRHRVQTARDVSNEFRDLVRQTSPKVAPARTSTPRAAAVDSGAPRADEGFWVAVLPFRYVGSDADLTALADGLTEDIVTGLSRFSYLRVIARGSTAKYSGELGDIRSIGKELGARYVMEGSLRQVGSKVRIAVQLVDASSGAGLWAETYDRAFAPDSTLDLLDEVVPRIVATVGDTQGVLPHSMTGALRNRDPESLTPYEAVLRSFGYHQLVNASEHLLARTALERTVEIAPGRADCWAVLSWLYRAEYTPGFNSRPDPLGRAVAAARRAIDLAPSNQLAHAALACALFFRREFTAFRAAAQRALALNRMEGYITAYLGQLLAYSGEWDAGCALAERATQLNPHHPGWYWLPVVWNAYRQHDGQRAQDLVLKINMPGLWTAQIALAAVYSQLGETALARDAVRDLLVLRPDFAANGPEELAKLFQPDLVEQLIADLRKAGLEIPDHPARPVSAAPAITGNIRTTSGAVRADEGFWVAVLPFRHAGSSEELKALADGLSEEIVTGLSRFSYLRVIARGSTAKYSSESGDVRAIGKELGARYVMEGSLRQAGTRLRLAVQLVDTVSGAHLWAENYERNFSVEAVFELEDDLVPRIVSTVADMYGILPRSMSEALRGKREDQLTPHEAVLRAFSYFERINQDEHANVRRILERAVEQAPDQADCWAMLSMIYRGEFAQGFNPQPDPLGRALAAAQRAVDLAPSNHLAYFAQAATLFFQKDQVGFRVAAERTIALNRMDGSTSAFMGVLMAASGDWEEGCALVESAMQLNPRHPGWYRITAFARAYNKGEYRAALEAVHKINTPGYFHMQAARAAALGQLGEREAAQEALQKLLALRPDFASVARQEYAKWYKPKLVEHLIDGLRKAGLAIADTDGTQTGTKAPDSGATRAEEGFWVAVLPFRYNGANADLTALVEGLTADIVTGLSRFSYLRVIARGSTAKYLSASADIRTIGKELGARYLMEGDLRQVGSKLRLVVQLVEATTGSHLWADNYERTFSPDAVFELQDDMVPRIVSTVADQHGILSRNISAAIRKKSDDQITPYEAVFRVFSLHEKMTEQEHAACRDLLERVVRGTPEASDCWAMLATLYADEDWFGFNLRPDPLGRAAAAAQRLFMRHEWQAFPPVAERTIALNPMDGAIIAVMGLMLACSGDWERGCAVADSAMRLHPNFPGWYWLATVFNAYRTRDYRAALDGALRIQMPGYLWNSITCAAAYGQLSEHDKAQKALRELLAARPNFAATARQELEKWFDAELAEHFLDGLRKAGLESGNVALATAPSSGAVTSTTASGATRADEGFWVAVLPFKYTGGNADLKALAEGLSEEVTTGLSRFSYLRVIARGSTAKYSSESGDVRAIGKELAARYVMEGSLRQAGSKLRLAVQLADTVSAAHLWAETYERTFAPESVFDVQDDLVPRIVSTVADQYGVLPRSMSETLRSKSEESLTPHEALLRSFSFLERISPTEHATARRILERAVERDPNQADAWAMLAILYDTEFADEFNPRPDPLERAMAAAQRAVDLAPTHALGYYALAFTYFFRKEMASFRAAAERALALNPMDGSVTGILGICVHHAGDRERGAQMAAAAMRLNPHHPPVLHSPAFIDAYSEAKYAEALDVAARMDMPGFFHAVALRAAALGQLGRHAAAQKALQELLALRPDFAKSIRRDYEKWWDSKTIDHLIEGLRKAGLEIPWSG